MSINHIQAVAHSLWCWKGSVWKPLWLRILESSGLHTCQGLQAARLPWWSNKDHQGDLEKLCLLSSSDSVTCLWCSIKPGCKTDRCTWVIFPSTNPGWCFGHSSSGLWNSIYLKALLPLTCLFPPISAILYFSNN